jgi:hypothetical protein
VHDTSTDEEVITSKLDRTQSPPPRYPISESSGSPPASPRPPPFSSLYTTSADSASSPAYAPVAPELLEPSTLPRDVVAETKEALPRDTKGESSSRKDDDSEPPPAYSEGPSPLESFTYLMAAAGGAASILTQVQQGGPQPINTLGGMCFTLCDWKGC